MLAGRKVRYGRLRVGIDVSAGAASNSGDGTAQSGWGCTLESYSIFNVALLSPGLLLNGYASEADGITQWVVDIPGLGVGDTWSSGGYSGTSSSWVEFVDVRLYEHFSSPWFLTVGSIEWYVDGALVSTFAGTEANATGLGPGYVPIFGIPPRLSGDVMPSVAGIGAIPYSYDCSQSGVITGRYEYQEVGSSTWVGLPFTPPTPVVPDSFSGCAVGLTPGGVIAGTTTSAVTINVHRRLAQTYQDFGGYYFEQFATESDGGWVYLVPNLDKSVVKLGDSYAAVIFRSGLPYTKSRGYRACGPAVPPDDGGEYPIPYTRVDIVDTLVHPSYADAEGTVRAALSALEAPLEAETYAPCGIIRSRLNSGWVGWGPVPGEEQDESEYPPYLDGFFEEGIDYRFPNETQQRTTGATPNADMAPYLDWYGGAETPAEVLNAITYWSYVCHPAWSYFYAPGSWLVDGSPTAWEAYWAKLGSQTTNEGTRTDLVSAPLLEGGNVDFINSIALGEKSSWWGNCSFIVDKPSIPASRTALGPSRWTLTNCTGTFSSTTLTLDSEGENIVAEYDLADWGIAPYLFSQFIQSFVLAWSSSNVGDLKVFLVGRDGTKLLLTDEPGEFPWPEGGLTSRKTAGSWAQDWGVGAVSDTGVDLKASGQSLAAMNDNQRVIASQLLPSRSAAKLRFEVAVEDPDASVTIDLPILKGPSERPHLFHESRQFASILSADGPGIRWGQSNFWNYLGDVFQYPPTVLPPGSQATVLDWLCWKRVVLEGRAATDALDAEIATLYDFGQEYTLRKHLAYETTAFVVRGEDHVAGVLCNTYQPPPLALFAENDRDAYLEPIPGSPVQKVWCLAQERRYAISTVDPVSLIKPPGADWLEAGPAVSGWFVRQHTHVTTGSEVDFKIRYSDTDWAKWRPWHGWFWVWGDGAAGGGLHLTRGPLGSLLLVSVDPEGADFRRFDLQAMDDSFPVRESDRIGSAQIAYSRHGFAVVAYDEEDDDDGWQIWRTVSSNLGETWEEPVALGTGERPAIAIDGMAMEYVVRWSGTAWRLWRRRTPDADLEDVADIFTGVEDGRPGLESSGASGAPLVFVIDDAGTVRRFLSTNQGETWEEA